MNLQKFIKLHKLVTSKQKEVSSSANLAAKIQIRLGATDFKNSKITSTNPTSDTNSLASVTFEVSNSKGIEIQDVDLDTLNRIGDSFNCKWYLKPISPKSISIFFQEYT